MTRRFLSWTAGCFAAGAATVGVILLVTVAMSGPVRIELPGDCSFSDWSPEKPQYLVRWDFPARPHPIWKYVRRKAPPVLPPGAIHPEPAKWTLQYAGPCTIRIETADGKVFRAREKWPRIMDNLREEPGEVLVELIPDPWRPVKNPCTADGELFDAGTDLPQRIRLTVAGEYYFEWRREDGRQKL